MEKEFQDYIRIATCIATASMALSTQSIQSTHMYAPNYFEAVSINSPLYLGSAVSFPSANIINAVEKEFPIKGYIKVKIRKNQKIMEWN